MELGKTMLTATFAVSLAIANVTATKLAGIAIPGVGLVAVPAGFVGIAVAFLCSDLLGEMYGYEAARDAVTATIAALVVGWGLVAVALALPAAPFYQDGAAFQTVLGASASIVTASIVTLAVSQHLDVWIFHRLRRWTGGRHKWLRNVGSTVTSQFVDTALFITLAFVVFPAVMPGSSVPLSAVPSLIAAQYVVKVAVALGDTPFFYALSGAVPSNEATESGTGG